MKKTAIIFFILIIALTLFIIKKNLTENIKNFFTGKTIQEENHYIYTTALCNESNFCQDYEIECKGKKLISSKPITGAVIQHDENWTDPRNITELCN